MKQLFYVIPARAARRIGRTLAPIHVKQLLYLFSRREKRTLVILLMLMIVSSLLEMIGVGVIPVFVLIVASPEVVQGHHLVGPVLEWLNIRTSRDLLIAGAIVLIAVFVIKNLVYAGLQFYKFRFVYRKQVDLGNRLFRAYMYAPYTFHLNRNTAELLRNVNGETKAIISTVLIPALTLILDAILMISILGLLLRIQPLTSFAVFVVLGAAAGVFLRVLNKRLKEYGAEELHHRKLKNKTVMQGLAGFKVAKVLGREGSFLDLYNHSAVRSATALRYKDMAGAINKPFIETIAVSMVLTMALVLVLQGRPVDTVVPLLVLFGAAAARLLPVFREVAKNYTTIRYGIVSVGPVFRDLKRLEDARRIQGTVGVPLRFQHSIALQDVEYRYPDAPRQALRRVSLSIPKGSAVGFVGPSGAGKTTAVDVILGLLEPQHGQVTADGTSIFADVGAWQRNIGYIPQAIFLTDDTIRRNIAFGLPDDEIDEGRVDHTVRAAQLEQFVSELPLGLDTVVGERGVRISGGQRQRIGIARALYNDPQVLVMDEATSALDNVTERYVLQAIDQLKGDRTIIMIAHRLTTVQNCDVIYLMEDGEVKESGTYEELMTRSAAFRRMSLAEA